MSSLSFPARWLLPLWLASSLVSCSADDTPIDYVGVVAPPGGKDTPVLPPYVAGQPTCTSTSTAPAPLPPVETSACAPTLPAGSGLPGLAVREGHILVGLGDRVAAFGASAQGCPSAPATDDATATQAAGALAVDSLIWAATSGEITALDPAGGAPASCQVPLATGLVALPSSGAVAIDGGSRFYPLSVSPGDPPGCAAAPVALPAGELVTAVAASASEGSVWLATIRDDCGPVPFIARRDLATGELSADSPVIEGRKAGLCRVSALVELTDRLVILDGGCSQILVVDPTTGTLLNRSALATSQTPLALTASPAGGALALLSSPGLKGATLSFLRLP